MLTANDIMTANLLLQLLRAPDFVMRLDALKSYLSSICKAKKWEDLATKTVYAVVAKKLIRIDRRSRDVQVLFNE